VRYYLIKKTKRGQVKEEAVKKKMLQGAAARWPREEGEKQRREGETIG